MSSSKETRDHDEIRKWVEKHDGVPAVVDTNGTPNDDDGILRIKFRDGNDKLEEITWEDFFEKFDERNLTFLYQDDEKSRFNKFVYDEEGDSGSGSKNSSKKK